MTVIFDGEDDYDEDDDNRAIYTREISPRINNPRTIEAAN